MNDDPIVDEIHRIREAISREHNDDLRAIAEAARARQEKSGHPVVDLSKSVMEPMVLKEEK